ncbi:methylated-DNA-protein-cysteine methyltransferase related protein [Andreprevotia lacus DSM 23236]|jgi:methylated-DNA-protein-cysteine methyltransferase-like protein|uniref:Methylated-DNA-protein-cysteine methyltransferase related protein n=1 Tax=Andreprevotia lacus DSM 23236 TaxID=1121001 RepID=A0A1W1Y0M1_9NEIS|nr:MGMT family protein [Andreprevotia lacus]SMC29706.1 methylated-DNA-protein-cysteine methyltransferase related protein [Andreprevotia lacus DSM 23236]
MKADMQAMRDAILAVVAAIPYGTTMSYGAVARAAGYPRHARMVGRVLAHCDVDVPWHRVVNAKGQISPRGLDGSDDLQRVLLEAEGVLFGAESGKVQR